MRLPSKSLQTIYETENGLVWRQKVLTLLGVPGPIPPFLYMFWGMKCCPVFLISDIPLPLQAHSFKPLVRKTRSFWSEYSHSLGSILSFPIMRCLQRSHVSPQIVILKLFLMNCIEAKNKTKQQQTTKPSPLTKPIKTKEPVWPLSSVPGRTKHMVNNC